MDEVSVAHANFVRPKLDRMPSRIIDDQVWASFQPDRACIASAAARLPGATNIMWGSDYPPADGHFPVSRRLVAEPFVGMPVSHAVHRDTLRSNVRRPYQ